MDSTPDLLSMSLDDIVASKRDRPSSGRQRSRRTERPSRREDRRPYAQRPRRSTSRDSKWKNDLYVDRYPASAKPNEAAQGIPEPVPVEEVPPPTSMVFVDNLSHSVEEDDIEREFRQIGPVSKVVVQYDVAGQPMGQAIVEFVTPEDAMEAQRTLDGERLLSITNRSLHIRQYHGTTKAQPRVSNMSIRGASSVFTRLSIEPTARPVAISTRDLRSRIGSSSRDSAPRNSRLSSSHRSSDRPHRAPVATKEDLDEQMDAYMQDS
ncbi:hypothetical protein H4R33_000465 [Dimargaris cristalligena]|uniref:RRM domain-containing protein n=1 Tax=Dimargaris cristalligena TaxID=215637 RepID=A0A4Q0A229_9FUNG|nr:hypothetical protein H4R33_000465 [Dimargaris cristalligena]RKP39868.1 hypothetical protein BJ085DRAFT_28221 [Dimargaris cristalligena]|eukprot:RKP39868.1 hypothetical protein BJ085DRAFT_28221 [Dimargaris cristalligena]